MSVLHDEQERVLVIMESVGKLKFIANYVINQLLIYCEVRNQSVVWLLSLRLSQITQQVKGQSLTTR